MVERKSRQGEHREMTMKEEKEVSFLKSVKVYFCDISIRFTWAGKLGMAGLLS